MDFHKNVIAAHLRVCAVSLFPYLDDWLIRDLIRNQLICHTKYTLQTVQNLGFIPNLKKSNLIPTQKFTFIGMEFLTQQKIVRVPANRIKALILTIETILSQTQVSGKLSAAADLILLGRLHLQPLQMCLLSVWKPHICPLDHQVTINSTRIQQKVLSVGSDYFSATFYQTYFYYKPSKYSPFTETHFCNLFTQSRKADKKSSFGICWRLIYNAAKRTSRRILISRKHFLKPWK